jgi:Holliday junction resolvase RusA-like endonuclease
MTKPTDNKILFKCHIKVPRHSSKKNEKRSFFNKRSGKMFIGKSDKALVCENWLKQKLSVEKLKQKIDLIKQDVSVKMIFHFPKSLYFTKQGIRSKKLPDLSNLYELPQDCMQSVGIIENDTLIVSHDGSRREPIDGPEYFLTIEIVSYDPGVNLIAL